NKTIDRVACQIVEYHDAAALELEHVFQIHVRPAKLNPQIKIDILEQLQRCLFTRGRSAGQVLQLKRSQSGQAPLDGFRDRGDRLLGLRQEILYVVTCI